jgi:ribonucleoside-diphosphate reductase alpha chain
VYKKADGTQVPLWHDSEVAAIAYAIQNIIAAKNGAVASDTSNDVPAPSPGIMAGSKCPECGAHAMIRKDGCDYCTQCGHVGACG